MHREVSLLEVLVTAMVAATAVFLIAIWTIAFILNVLGVEWNQAKSAAIAIVVIGTLVFTMKKTLEGPRG